MLVAFWHYFGGVTPVAEWATPCETKKLRLDGLSLEPAFPNGTILSFHVGSDCPYGQIIEENSIVLLRTGLSSKSVAKFVRGMPGDSIMLNENEDGSASVRINKQVVKNSAGDAYRIPSSQQAVFQLYVRDYGGTIPPSSYLLLGDQVSGSLDSTRFGFAHVNDIVGVLSPAD